MKYFFPSVIFLSVLSSAPLLHGQNVFIVAIDGARYTETFGSRETYIPRIWNTLRPEGTIYTAAINDSVTKTCPGHSALITATWQNIANNGSERVHAPTLFELYRKQTGAPEQSCYFVSGKAKLEVLAYSTDPSYGKMYGASFRFGKESDRETWNELKRIMEKYHPRIVLVNFASVDLCGHEGKWDKYLSAIRDADSLSALLWETIQSDSVYQNTTTLFITDDHGRHDDAHGGFQNHGDSCEGCRHIFLTALGPQFTPGTVVTDTVYQVDVGATAAKILGISLPPAANGKLLRQFHAVEDSSSHVHRN